MQPSLQLVCAKTSTFAHPTGRVNVRARFGTGMTVAAFLLECEVCHDKMGLLSGAVTSFICFSCAADKVFGTGGKDGSSRPVAAGEPVGVQSGNVVPTTAAETPVPAIPMTPSTPPTAPLLPQGDAFFCP